MNLLELVKAGKLDIQRLENDYVCSTCRSGLGVRPALADGEGLDFSRMQCHGVEPHNIVTWADVMTHLTLAKIEAQERNAYAEIVAALPFLEVGLGSDEPATGAGLYQDEDFEGFD